MTVHAPAQTISQRVPQSVLVEALDDRTCVVHADADTPQQLALHLLMLDTDFEVDEAPELIEVLHLLTGRFATAVNNTQRRERGRRIAQRDSTTSFLQRTPPSSLR